MSSSEDDIGPELCIRAAKIKFESPKSDPTFEFEITSEITSSENFILHLLLKRLIGPIVKEMLEDKDDPLIECIVPRRRSLRKK